ncbi:tyramine beta-hydroxylase-like [Saccostrea cucullata]|uniref:tyramine beta-hydroxylase-like n=1 Tax=Saccostrea cuccullata TaxID=36930 RepID=UPI002ED585F2
MGEDRSNRSQKKSFKAVFKIYSFGKDFDAAGKKWTQELCRKDSDGDGKTNGEELGDPNCVWRENAIPDKNAISHPGVCKPFNGSFCGPKNTWVTCELESFKCDAINQPGVKNITLRYNETRVPSKETNYFCKTFELPNDGDYHLIATTPYIDNEYVMHHILLFGCNGSVNPGKPFPVRCGMTPSSCLAIIGGWTVGSNGECAHKDVGFRIGQNGFKFATLQFHWNNPERRSDYNDSSGMTLYYTPNRRPNDAAILVVGQDYLEIPPGKDRVEVDAICSADITSRLLSGPVYITRAFNHMHYLGREEYIEQYRNGVKINTLTNNRQYSYDRPRMSEYDTSIEVLPGDEIRTKCVYKSSSKSVTTFKGDATSDEMCYGFLAIHPLSNLRFQSQSLYCTSWKSLSTIQLHVYDVTNGCNRKTFLNFWHPDMANISRRVFQSCRPLSMCLEECKDVVKEIRRHPCMQGDVREYLKMEALQSHNIENLQFYSMIESCDLEMLQETMKNQTKGNTNDGSRLSLHLFMLVTLLLFCIFKVRYR